MFVSGETEYSEESEEEVRVWTSAIEHALQKLTEGHSEYKWRAVIGNASGICTIPNTLADPLRIGRLALRQADFGYSEARHENTLSGWSQHDWIPVIVEGTAARYSWEAAAEVAHRELHKLCALLSLQTDEYWVLRERARPADKPISLPEQTPCLQRVEAAREIELRKQVVTINREHLALAWQLLQQDNDHVRLLRTYYEGVGLAEQHPSFAMVAFVATIEGVGIWLEKEGLLPKSNSLERFRQTLKLVVSEEKARWMTTVFYGKRRSATAHAGHLFGCEEVFGEHRFREAHIPPSQEDLFGSELYRTQMAAKDLLIKLLFEGGFKH